MKQQYQQFIGLEVITDKQEYQIVGKTADLNKTEEQLLDICLRYRFWGTPRPSVSDDVKTLQNNKAVGFFLEDDQVVLVQASVATDGRQIFRDLRGRPFFLQRYIYIPLEHLRPLKFQMVKLLSWLYRQNLPILTHINLKLEPLSIPIDELSAKTEPYDEVVTTIKNLLNEGNLLELSLKSVLNNQRLIFNFCNGKLESSEYIKILLRLLPAQMRVNYPVAIGMFDEDYCHWARLLYKVDYKSPKLDKNNLIWVDRDNGRLKSSLVEEIQPENKYVTDIITPSLTNFEKLKKLLEQLDKINYDSLKDQQITDPEVAFCLIPYLSEGQTNRIIENLKAEELENLLTSYADFPEDLQNLLNYSAISLASRKSTLFINHIVKILKESKTTATREILNTLKKNPEAAKEIIKKQGLQQIPLAIQDELLEQIFAIYLAVVETEVKKGQAREAKKQAKHFAEQNIFQNTQYNFLLKDAAISDQDTQDTVKNYFNDELVLTLPKITPTAFESSQLAKKLENQNLFNLIKEILQLNLAGLLKILELGRTTQMTQAQTDLLLLQFLNRLGENPPVNLQQLLQEMFKKVLFEQQDWLFDYLNNTYKWFENRLSTGDGLIAAIAKFKTQPNVWSNWLELFSNLYTTTIPNEALDKGYEVSLTKQTITAEAILPKIVEKWLEGPTDLFTKSFTWAVLLQELENHNFDRYLGNWQGKPYLLKLINSLDYVQQYKYITGKILENLGRLLNNQQSSQNQNLIKLINSQKVTQHFTNNDWVTLAKIDWNRYNVDRQPRPEVYPSLSPDAISQIAAVAQESIQGYSQANSVTYLLEQVSSWGLNTTQQEEILQFAKPGACNPQLIFKYLGDDGTNLPQIFEKENLFKLLLQIESAQQEEQEKIKSFFSNVFNKYLKTNDNLEKLRTWAATGKNNKIIKTPEVKIIFASTLTDNQEVDLTNEFDNNDWQLILKYFDSYYEKTKMVINYNIIKVVNEEAKKVTQQISGFEIYVRHIVKEIKRSSWQKTLKIFDLLKENPEAAREIRVRASQLGLTQNARIMMDICLDPRQRTY